MASTHMGLQTCDIPYRLYLFTVVAVCQDISVYSNCYVVGYIYLQQLLWGSYIYSQQLLWGRLHLFIAVAVGSYICL
jgi:hypothetical protein